MGNFEMIMDHRNLGTHEELLDCTEANIYAVCFFLGRSTLPYRQNYVIRAYLGSTSTGNNMIDPSRLAKWALRVTMFLLVGNRTGNAQSCKYGYEISIHGAYFQISSSLIRFEGYYLSSSYIKSNQFHKLTWPLQKL